MTTAALLLCVRGVRKRFGATIALDGVDLDVRRGDVHALLGENGAGKSTLMKILAGAHAADAGSITLDGVPFAPRSPIEARRAGIAMIHQELTICPHLTVEQNVALGREESAFGFVRGAALRRRLVDVLARLGRPDIDPRKHAGALPPGDRQLVEIARALIFGARVVVMDEPTSSLSRRDTERLFDVIRRLKQDGVPVIYISHFLEEVREIADRFTVLRDGKTVGTGDVATTPTATLVTMMAGRPVAELYPRAARAVGDVVFRVRDLTGTRLPRHASFEVRRGEVFGIAGLVGAGRTELLRAVFGLDPIRGGSVDALGRVVGLLSEDRKGEGLALGLSIGVNVTLSRLGPLSRFGWIRLAARDRAAQTWIERLGIRAQGPAQRVDELSGGNQQKVALARLLHHDVDVLLLDEPTRGVDVASKVEIYRLIGDLAARGKSVVFVSSYFPELLQTCDRIAVMHRGVLDAAKPASDWTEHALLLAATSGDAEAGDAA